MERWWFGSMSSLYWREQEAKRNKTKNKRKQNKKEQKQKQNKKKQNKTRKNKTEKTAKNRSRFFLVPGQAVALLVHSWLYLLLLPAELIFSVSILKWVGLYAESNLLIESGLVFSILKLIMNLSGALAHDLHLVTSIWSPQSSLLTQRSRYLFYKKEKRRRANSYF